MQNETDSQLIFRALNYWANHIETGDIVMSAEDAKNAGLAKSLKPLTEMQVLMIARLRRLAAKELIR